MITNTFNNIKTLYYFTFVAVIENNSGIVVVITQYNEINKLISNFCCYNYKNNSA